ncbi:MAG: AzlD domain-containing protein [Eubacteriales bacterium]|nr:AzlD domain-containing protein [Eubacteriales bacterium]
MKNGFVITAILLAALITFSLRALPFAVFRGNRSMPAWLDRLGKALPSAIMAVLVVYCLKDAADGGSRAAAGLIAALATAVLYKWRHNTFLGIAGGTAVYMALLHTL